MIKSLKREGCKDKLMCPIIRHKDSSIPQTATSNVKERSAVTALAGVEHGILQSSAGKFARIYPPESPLVAQVQYTSL